MKSTTEQNKAIVRRFNYEFLELGNMKSFMELVAEDVYNHSAPIGSSTGPDGMIYFINEVLRKGFPDLKVKILDQIAEGDMVTSRKELSATHTGEFMDIRPSNKKVVIQVIDIIRLHDGKYAEHWGMSNLSDIIREIAQQISQ
jgi:predicted ester cyclase